MIYRYLKHYGHNAEQTGKLSWYVIKVVVSTYCVNKTIYISDPGQLDCYDEMDAEFCLDQKQRGHCDEKSIRILCSETCMHCSGKSSRH